MKSEEKVVEVIIIVTRVWFYATRYHLFNITALIQKRSISKQTPFLKKDIKETRRDCKQEVALQSLNFQ